jgi:hypothetical protein
VPSPRPSGQLAAAAAIRWASTEEQNLNECDDPAARIGEDELEAPCSNLDSWGPTRLCCVVGPRVWSVFMPIPKRARSAWCACGRGRPAVLGDPRAHPPDRGEGAAQVEAPESVEDSTNFPRQLMRRYPVNTASGPCVQSGTPPIRCSAKRIAPEPDRSGTSFAWHRRVVFLRFCRR